MKLAFKRYGFGYTLKEVPVEFNILTLKMISKELDIDFWELSTYAAKNKFEFMYELLYQGYISACKEKYSKPKYDRTKAIIWYEHISKETEDQLSEMLKGLFGDIKSMSPAGKKKVKREQHGTS